MSNFILSQPTCIPKQWLTKCSLGIFEIFLCLSQSSSDQSHLLSAWVYITIIQGDVSTSSDKKLQLWWEFRSCRSNLETPWIPPKSASRTFIKSPHIWVKMILEERNPCLKADKITQQQFPSNFGPAHICSLVWGIPGGFHSEWYALPQQPGCQAAHWSASELRQFLAGH